jgi:hypothetical protein
LRGDTLSSIKGKKSSTMEIKLDLSKDYDKTSSLYIRLMLLHVGFNYLVVRWIMGCLTSISFVVLLNDSASIFFKLVRG